VHIHPRITSRTALRLALLGLAIARAAWGQAPAEAAPARTAQPSASQQVDALLAPVADSTYAGRRVAAIDFRDVLGDEKVREYLRELVVQKPNEALDRRKIRQSLQALYATGRFSDVRAEVEPVSATSLNVVFVVRPNYFVGYQTTEGTPKRPTSGQLLDSAKFQLGELFTQAKLDSAVRRMKALLAENGYYLAQITPYTTPHPENQLIDVRYAIEPGPPAHIGGLIIEGEAGLTAEQIAKTADMETGHTVTAARVSNGLQKLRKKYSKRDQLEAEVALIDRTYRPETNTVDFTFKIVPGRKVDVRVDGASISKRKLKKYVPIYEEHAVDDDLLNEGSRNLRNYLQTEGYFDAEVAYRQQADPAANRLDIIYSVERGDKHRLVAIHFQGNKYFDDAILRERLQIQTKSFSLKHGRYSQALLNNDVDSLTNLYRANGFDQVKVKTEVMASYGGKPSDLAIVFHFEEGPQERVHSLRIEGDYQVPEDELRGLLTMVEGQPYSDASAAADREAVLSYYFNHGYPDVEFQATTEPAPNQPNQLDVTYKITEGQQIFVDRVLLSQLHYTRRNVVEKQMQIQDGDPLSQVQMLKSQERLYNLGVFNEVQMAVQNPDGDSRYKDVLLQFQEARRWTFNYGFGIEASTGQPSPSSASSSSPTTVSQGNTGVSPRVSFDLTRINFRGRAHTISLKSSYGSLQKRGLISYDAPRWTGNPNLRLTFTAFYDNTIDVTTFTSERLEGSAQIEQKVNRSTTLVYRFVYRRVKATDVVVSPDLIPILSQPVRVGMPNFTYIRDKRDDPIDSHNGNYTTFDSGVATQVFGSEADFGRFLITNSTYHPFHNKKWVFARSLRVGIAQPWADTIVPLPERFFAGGANTHRGFSLNQAGPRDLGTGSPLGGNALLLNNLELRFPPISLPFVGEGFSFVAFHDVGNVFEDSKEMVRSVFRWYQPRQDFCRDPNLSSQCSFSYMSQAVGGGIRYKTPIGPVRVDIGYNLNPTVYPQFSTNSAGQQIFTPQVTRRVNFYFSIGQTF